MNLIQKKNYKIILKSLLIGIIIFSVFEYFRFLKEKYVLVNNLNQAREQVLTLELKKQDFLQAIEKEKELQRALSAANSALKDELRTNTEKLAQLDADFQVAQKRIEELTSLAVLSQVENTALREEKDALMLEFTKVSQEKDALKARLSSIPELRKAIKQLRSQMRRSKATVREITRTRKIIAGNCGFLIKNGESTHSVSKIKIEVMPIKAKE